MISIPQEKRQRIIERYKAGDLIDDIVDEEATSRSPVFRILKEAGLSGSRWRRYTPEERQRFVDLVKSGQTIRAVAKTHGVSKKQLGLWVNERGIHPSNPRKCTPEIKETALAMFRAGEKTDDIARVLDLGNRGTVNRWARQAGIARPREDGYRQAKHTKKINGTTKGSPFFGSLKRGGLTIQAKEPDIDSMNIESWNKFVNYHRKFLALNEIKHSIFLSILDKPFDPETMYWQFERPGHCAIMESGRRAIVLGNLSGPECRHLAEMTADLDYRGVLGIGLTPHWFGNRASELGIHFKLVEAQQIYQLREAPRRPAVQGHARPFREDETQLFIDWYTKFHDEARCLDPLPSWRHLEDTALNGRYLLWEDDYPVSMAGYIRPLRSCASITGVYTPENLRGKGYAGAITAAVADVILDQGRVAILYTDLQNPASNRCYSRLGFKAEYPSFHLHC